MQGLLESVVVGGTPLGSSRVFQGSSVDIGQPAFPFLIHKFSIGAKSISNRAMPGLEVWCYDEPGSYLRIDKTLWQIRYILGGYPFTSADGTEHIAVVDWTNDSADLPAEEFHGITRMSAFNLIGRNA